MRVYKLEVIVIDHDRLGPEGIRSAIENARYPNRCIAPEVISSQSQDIGEWYDGHPLNRRDTFFSELLRLFPQGPRQTTAERPQTQVTPLE